MPPDNIHRKAVDMSKAFEQIAFLWYEIQLITNKRWWRWFGCWFSPGFWAVAPYRLSRFFYLLLGRGWSVLRIPLSPLMFLLSPWTGRCDIHYRAEIGRGLIVLHPALGVVISGHAVIGEHLILTGGNCIGYRGVMTDEPVRIGSHVELGANAVVLGPVHIGNHVRIGAGAVVLRDAADGQILVGVPARPVEIQKPVSPLSEG